MRHVASEENHNKNIVSIVGLWVERRTSSLRLYNNNNLTVVIGVKSLSKICFVCTFLFNANNYKVLFFPILATV